MNYIWVEPSISNHAWLSIYVLVIDHAHYKVNLMLIYWVCPCLYLKAVTRVDHACKPGTHLLEWRLRKKCSVRGLNHQRWWYPKISFSPSRKQSFLKDLISWVLWVVMRPILIGRLRASVIGKFLLLSAHSVSGWPCSAKPTTISTRIITKIDAFLWRTSSPAKQA